MKINLSGRSFLHALGTAAYIAAISWFFFNGERWLGNKPDNFFMPMFMLLLLVVSATITGGLVLGKPLLMYLDGEKKPAIKMLLATVAWLLVLVAIVALVLFLK